MRFNALACGSAVRRLLWSREACCAKLLPKDQPLQAQPTEVLKARPIAVSASIFRIEENPGSSSWGRICSRPSPPPRGGPPPHVGGRFFVAKRGGEVQPDLLVFLLPLQKLLIALTGRQSSHYCRRPESRFVLRISKSRTWMIGLPCVLLFLNIASG